MSRTSFLQDLLATIFERGAPRTPSNDRRSMKELCAALLSEQGEASGSSIATAILDRYEASSPKERSDFFRLLVEDHDIDADAIIAAATAYKESRDADILARLVEESEPPRQELLRRLNRLPGATGRVEDGPPRVPGTPGATPLATAPDASPAIGLPSAATRVSAGAVASVAARVAGSTSQAASAAGSSAHMTARASRFGVGRVMGYPAVDKEPAWSATRWRRRVNPGASS